MFPWSLLFSWRDLYSFSFYCLPVFLCTVHLRRLSCFSLLFSVTLHSIGYIFLFSPSPFISLLSSAICKASSDNHFAFLHFFGMVLVTASYGFSHGHVRMWELDHKEGWALDNWWFWIVVLEKIPESLLDCKEIKPSILKEINSECTFKGLILKLQYFGHLMWRADSLEKTLMLGKIEGKKRKRKQRMRWLDSVPTSMNMNLSKLEEIVKDRGTLHAAVPGVTKSHAWTWLSNWTITTKYPYSNFQETE